jgi:murein DD-endopeptidase MepM/ murein hydrolase activator NlpD
VRRAIGGCALVGGLELLSPQRLPLLIGPVAQTPAMQGGVGGGLVYPADGSIATASLIRVETSGCGGSRPASGSVLLRSLSLFGGAITARRVELRLPETEAGKASQISGLAIDGDPVAILARLRLPVQSWGYAVVQPTPAAAAGTSARTDAIEASALAVHVLEPHAGLAAGTVLLVSFAALPPGSGAVAAGVGVNARPSARVRSTRRGRRSRKSAQQLGEPLTVTPPLGLRHYIFPVAGQSDYVNTYGAFRSDVPGNWHHGDDIFAALGTPVVAVANGTLNRVGWEKLGGWRLWVRDSLGDEFYYAHLSGYSPLALHSKRVRAGEVIGFIGDTGDAFTTSPHLHFEIHPRSLLYLGYNGAVDPTGYLNHWQHLTRLRTPKPVHPPFPAGAVRTEAAFVWRELLTARGLIRHGPSANQRPRIRIPGSDSQAVAPLIRSRPALAGAPTPARRRTSNPLPLLLASLIALTGLAALAGLIQLGRRRLRRPTPNSPAQTLPTQTRPEGRQYWCRLPMARGLGRSVAWPSRFSTSPCGHAGGAVEVGRGVQELGHALGTCRFTAGSHFCTVCHERREEVDVARRAEPVRVGMVDNGGPGCPLSAVHNLCRRVKLEGPEVGAEFALDLDDPVRVRATPSRLGQRVDQVPAYVLARCYPPEIAQAVELHRHLLP